VAVATHIGPDELLRHPAVFDAIVEILEKQGEDDKRQKMKQRLRKATGRG
jgi:hypothetical protein